MSPDVKEWLDATASHLDCDDCWYSCATLTCDDRRKSDTCDCGADAENAIRAKLRALLLPQPDNDK